MNDQNKTKEELIRELKELRQKHILLKTKIVADYPQDDSVSRQTELELRLKKIVFDSSIAANSIADSHGVLTEINNTFLKIWGYKTKDMVVGRPISEFIQNQDEAVAIVTALNTIDVWEGEYTAKRKDGSVFIAHGLATTIRDLQGNLMGYHSAVIDITDRKETEKKLMDNELRFRTAFDKSPVGEVIVGLDKRFIKSNEAFCEFIGYSNEELIGKTIADITYPEDRELGMLDLKLMSEGKTETATVQKRYVRKNGAIVWGEISIKMVRDSHNNPLFFLPVIIDITERKLTEQKLRESNELFAMFMAHSPIYTFIKDVTPTECVVLQASENYQQMIGIKGADMIGKTMTELFPPDLAAKIIADDWACVSDQKVFTVDEELNGRSYTTIKFPIYHQDKTLLAGYTIDITDKKHAEAELIKAKEVSEENEKRYRGLITNIEAGVVVHAADTSIIMSNPRACELLGLSEDQMKGKVAIDPQWKFIAEDNTPIPVSEFPVTRIVKSKKAFNYQILGVCRNDNDIVWLLVNGFPVINNDDEITEIIISFIDITERKKLEEKIIESHALLRIAGEKAKLGGWNVILKENRSYWSDQVAAIHEMPAGYAPLVEDGINFYAPEWRDRITKVFTDCAQKGIPYDEDMEILTSTGKRVWVRTSGEAVTDENGKIYKVHGSFQDITERKKAEEKLKESELKYRSLIENTNDVVFCVDEKGEYKFTNHVFAKTFGKTPEYFIGKTFWDIYPKEEADHRYEAVKEMFRTGEVQTIEVNIPLPDRTLSYLAKANPIKDENGKVILNLTTAIDITDRKKNELELLKAKEKAEESDRLKSAFLANMSHEIRTPMNGILGFADLLKKPGLTDEKQQIFIDIIEKSGKRMLNIINDIIDISKIESGLMKLSVKETNINEQIEFIYTFFKPETEAKGLTLSFKTPLPAKQAIIKTDREKLYAILVNLVKNAIKFTKKGSIEFGYEIVVVDAQNNVHQIRFHVKDTGIGIPKNRQEAIFERFVQADIADKMAYQGAGLGLSISKAYAEMLGGEIFVESEEGLGSTFYFTVPYNFKNEIETSDDKSTNSEKNPNIRKLKILIAEDDVFSEMLLDETVKMFCREIIKAKSGTEVIQACRENPDTDLIFMDIHMPKIGGYEATKHIREFNKEVIIIAQTAFGLSGDREKAIESGCNDYIAKPYGEKDIQTLIQKYFRK